MATYPLNPTLLLQAAARSLSASQFPEAERACRETLRVAPNNAEAQHLLGQALMGLGRAKDAVAAHRRAVTLDRSSARYRLYLADALMFAGELRDAEIACRKAVELEPGFDRARTRLGVILGFLGKHEEALLLLEAALAKDPDDLEALLDIGTSLVAQGRVSEAIEHQSRACRMRPNDSNLKSNLAATMATVGKLEAALSLLRQVVAASPRWTSAHSNLLFLLTHHEEDPAKLLAEHQRLAQRLDAEPRMAQHPNDRNPDRRLWIAYLSSDLRQHPVASFLEPILANHDRACFEIFCYSDSALRDAMTERLRRGVNQWRETGRLDNAELAERIAADRIDILIDLGLHSNGGRRIPLLARKPAPVQAVYLGYAATTGLASVDWRITDPVIDLPGLADQFSTERLLRLPATQWVYSPPETTAQVGALPALKRGHVTFGSVNKRVKIGESVLALWARIHQRMPGSRLIIKGHGLSDARSQEPLRRVLESHGVSPDRVDLSGPVSPAQYMQFFNEMDIALDSYPFAGGSSTCDALWMGVPVVTRTGATSVSRVAASALTNIGLPDLIADSPDAYVEIAVSLAGDLDRLEALRRGLRNRFRQSPLFDAPAFVRHLEAGYRHMWRQWCAESHA